jgi:hypothetical protein
LYYLWPTLFLL